MKIMFIGDSLTQGRPGLSYVERLQQQLPKHTLLNQGKNGDSVISLYHRIKKTLPDGQYDLAFLWVGTNDILTSLHGSRSMVPKIILRQLWAKNKEEFREYYQKTLDILRSKAKNIVTVSPLFIGEDMQNPWNKQLEELSAVIKDLSNGSNHIHFLDLRKEFLSRLPSTQTSEYIPPSYVLLADGLLHKTAVELNTMANKRGLYFTTDGIHLNSRGIQVVTEVFMDIIMKYSTEKK